MIKEKIVAAFEILVKERWIKYIDKEAEKLNRMTRKAKRQAYVVCRMVDEYNKIYPEEKIKW